ncbi:WAT1-related protein At1g43650-like isoform X2 [Quercus robur]|uniref:WAT1-related protein At1g43650-like isoform X2 n=1 Tax=Quercus robur TaxID=38942 RepID=UPI0021627144|nr:WAT1-related protein At1g43650-like isoform X2 [Quercus robur]
MASVPSSLWSTSMSSPPFSCHFSLSSLKGTIGLLSPSRYYVMHSCWGCCSKYNTSSCSTSLKFFSDQISSDHLIILHIWISLSQVLFTMSLQFVASTYQSVGLNLIPSLVFVMALIFHQEKLKCWSIYGQAKIWGLALSAAGALVVLLWKGPVVLNSMLFNIQATSDVVTGSTMIIVGVLAKSFSNILVGQVIQFYPAELSLTAMMSLFGTIQTAVVSAFVISWSSWDLKWEKGLVLVTILLGGIVVTGLSYYVMTWSIKKKGPVFHISI